MERNLVIVGAGVAGLAAGCFAARNGYRTTILESAATPGGLCTSWRRKGYQFDGSAAGLAGSAPGTPIYSLWKDIGVIDYCELYDPDTFGSIRCTDGVTVKVYTDIERLGAHLTENLPGDERVIDEFVQALKVCARIEIPYASRSGLSGVLEKLWTGARAIPVLPALMRFGKTTLADLCTRLVNPRSREVFANLVHFGGPDVPLLTVLLPIAYAHRKMTGIPRRGWLSFARAIERRFLELGGSIRYRSAVTALHTNGSSVGGVVLDSGEVIRADRVLSAADGYFTRATLLGQPRSEVERTFEPARLSDQPVQVSLGVAEDWSEVSGPMTYILGSPVTAAGRPQHRLTVHNGCRNPDAAPPGKSALIAFLDSEYGFWHSLRSDRSAYEHEKQACARMVIDTIAASRPGFDGRVEVVDVATPLTRERYTGNRYGAMQARRPDASTSGSLLGGGPKYDVATHPGFYMAGQWVEPWGGITTAAQSGRNAVIAMCSNDGLRFR